MKFIFYIILGSFLLGACSTTEQNEPIQEKTELIELTDKAEAYSKQQQLCSKTVWNPNIINNKQFIALGFDGSYNNDVWKETLDFAQDNNVKFTFYIVGTHLLTDSNKKNYISPSGKSGRSDVGFGGTKDELLKRLEMIQRAYLEGHEIAGHANGHYNGSEWTFDEWDHELKQFKHILANVYEINQIDEERPEVWEEIVNSIVGFRAPLLAYNENLFKALKANSYTYDTSKPIFSGTPPQVDKYGIWHLGLPTIQTSKGPTLSMDYNFYMRDKVNEKNPEKNMLDAYNEYYNQSSSSEKKLPMQIGHHFSRWNNGSYWNALKLFIKQNCNNDQTICSTNKILSKELSKKFVKKCKS
jgi:peptidoglycan/xylan/chitin deacetylase (PgdA/CDA1 family)